MSENTFVCAMCEETFLKGWSDDEAMAEFKRNYPGPAMKQEYAILCDECHEEFREWFEKNYKSGGMH